LLAFLLAILLEEPVVNLDLFQTKMIRHLPQRVIGRLEASDTGILRVVYGGTSWRFKLLVSMGQIIQLLPGQTVTIVGVEDTSTLIIEV
jgi:membrane protein implicated in regulation of membrane protease activity